MNDPDLSDAFDRLVEPLPAPSPLLQDTHRRGARRRQSKFAGGGAVAAAAVVGVALLVLPSPEDDRVLPPAQRPPAAPSEEPDPEAPPLVGPGPEITGDPARPTVALQGDGLGLVSGPESVRMQLFGEADPQALQNALTRSLGPGTPSAQPDCGATVTTVSYDGLQIVVEDGRFVGWLLTAPGPRLTTTVGVGPGSTLAELRALTPLEITQTTLGTEWTAASLSGLLDGVSEDSVVTDMWAGRVCLFR